MATNLKRAAASSAVVAKECCVKSVALEGGSANSTVQLFDAASGAGTAVLSLAAVIGSSAVWTSGDHDGVYFSVGVYATLTGAGAAVTIEYE